MAIFLEMPKLAKGFPFRVLVNDGNILTTPHWHREIELIYVTEGTISLGINDTPYVLSAGEIVFINGGEIHYVLASPGSERLVFQFDLNLFSELNAENLNLAQLFSQISPLSKDWGIWEETIKQLLIETFHEARTKINGHQFAIKSNLYKIVVLFIRNLPRIEKEATALQKTKSEEILEKLDQVFRFVEQRYTENILLEEAAEIIGYSQFYFTKFFKRNTGKTFITFLNDYRIDKAKWFLINGNDSVSEIITQVGFESDKTFYRLFKRSMGISPLMYRKKMKAEN